jgi:hypothetical protein
MNYKKNAKIMTDDFWNELMGGEFDLKQVLLYEDDVEDIQKAIKLLNDLKTEMENNEVLIYY